jgi:hypothetical protein
MIAVPNTIALLQSSKNRLKMGLRLCLADTVAIMRRDLALAEKHSISRAYGDAGAPLSITDK